MRPRRYDTDLDQNRGLLRRAMVAAFAVVAMALNLVAALTVGAHSRSVDPALAEPACAQAVICGGDNGGLALTDGKGGVYHSSHCLYCLPLMHGALCPCIHSGVDARAPVVLASIAGRGAGDDPTFVSSAGLWARGPPIG